MAANPPPDLAPWAAIEDPAERLATALGELYPYYRATEGMMANVLRDAPAMPVVDRNLGAYRGFLAAALDVLMAGRRSRRAARAAIGHALAFPTWRSLTREQQLTDAEAAQLMCRLVAAA
jgi:hypothetical protein